MEGTNGPGFLARLFLRAFVSKIGHLFVKPNMVENIDFLYTQMHLEIVILVTSICCKND
jgi:hypothetical protein